MYKITKFDQLPAALGGGIETRITVVHTETNLEITVVNPADPLKNPDKFLKQVKQQEVWILQARANQAIAEARIKKIEGLEFV